MDAIQKFKIRREPIGVVAAEFGSGETYELDEDTYDIELDEQAICACEYYENRNTQHSELGAPLTMVVYPTYSCNVRCKFCYVYNEPKPADHMSYDVADAILAYARHCGITHIDILGGEPFLPSARSVTYQLLQGAVEAGIRPYVSTNGLLLHKHDYEEIHELQSRCRWFDIAVSLHGPDPIHNELVGNGTYDQALSTIRKLDSAGISFTISSTIDSVNLNSFADLYECLRDFEHFRSWILNYPPCSPQMSQGHELPSISETYNAIKDLGERVVDDGRGFIPNLPFTYKIEGSAKPVSPVEKLFGGCSAGRTKVEIAPNGDAYPCAYLIGIEQFRMGNIRDGSFSWDIFADREQWCVTSRICRNKCEYGDLCTGCLAHIYFSRKEVDDRCPAYRKDTLDRII